MKKLFTASQLEIGYRSRNGVKKAVGPVDFQIEEGECVGLIGESGAGKSTLALEILGLLGWKSGARIAGRLDLFINRDEIAYIPQDPHAALDPLCSIGAHLREVAKDRSLIEKALEQVRLPLDKISLNSYPHELSGGMKQRVLIAMALLRQPKLIVADEPTSSLDVTLQADIMDLFRQIRGTGMAFLFVTHQMPLTRDFCQRVVIMRAGIIVEQGRLPDLFLNPGNPYTRMLIDSVPRLCLS